MEILKRLGKFLGVGAALVVATLMTLPAFAVDAPEFRIQISPVRLDLDLQPGQSYEKTFQVQNTGQNEFDFSVSVSPYSVAGEDYKADLTTETRYTDIVNWVTFSQDEGTVEPYSVVEITAYITVPEDVPAGGQYATILAQMDNSDSEAGSSVAVTQQVGLIIYANVDGVTRTEGTITENKISSFLFEPPITATSVVENTGNTHVNAEYILQVFPLFGDEEVYTNEENPETYLILPETKRLVTTSWDGAPKLGIFRVKQTVKAFGQTSVTEKMVFICPIWFLFVVALVLICIVFWIVSRVRGKGKE